MKLYVVRLVYDDPHEHSRAYKAVVIANGIDEAISLARNKELTLNAVTVQEHVPALKERVLMGEWE